MTRIVLLIFFGLFAAYGAFWVVRYTHKARAPRKYKNSILEWTQGSLSGFKYEREMWVANGLHQAAVVLLGLVVLLMLALHPVTGIHDPWGDVTAADILIAPILVVGICYVGLVWGQGVLSPIARCVGGDQYYAISAEGILFQGFLFPWNIFSHHTFDANENVVRLWSASSPGVVSFVLPPPLREETSKLIEILQSYLPREPAASSPSYSKFLYPSFMASISMLIVAIACLMFPITNSLVLIADGILMYVLALVGGKATMHFVYGGRVRPAPLE